MRKMIGSEIAVYLKSSSSIINDVIGLLVDVDEDSLYVQDLDMASPVVFIIPRDNVKYCKTNAMPTTELFQIKHQPIEEQKTQSPFESQEKHSLEVVINGESITKIPVPYTFCLDKWNDDIMKVIMGNPETSSMIENKVLKSIEYWPGRAQINVENAQENQISMSLPSTCGDNFSMGGDISQQFLNPSQMILRLNAIAKGKKNDQTKM